MNGRGCLSWAAATLVALAALIPDAVVAEGIAAEVTTNDEGVLRATVAHGGVIHLNFAGTVRLTSPLVIESDTVLEATNTGVVLSGNGQVRVLEVRTNIHFTLRNVTVAEGRSDQGGGLFNNGGIVALLSCLFTRNQAIGMAGTNGPILSGEGPPIEDSLLSGGNGRIARGGAVFNQGVLRISNSVFEANQAVGGNGGTGGAGRGTLGSGGHGAVAAGGAMFHEAGDVRVFNSRFHGNLAQGGSGGSAQQVEAVKGSAGGSGGGADGGAIAALAGQLDLEMCQFETNQAVGGGGGGGGMLKLSGIVTNAVAGPGGDAGAGRGGAVFNLATGRVAQCEFNVNQGVGGGGAGGGQFETRWPMSYPMDPGPAGGVGGRGGHGEGGGVWNGGSLELGASSWIENTAQGGGGGLGARGTINYRGQFGWSTPGAAGGVGGNGRGGGLMNTGWVAMLSTTWVGNSAYGGSGGVGGAGGGWFNNISTPKRVPGGQGGAGGHGYGGALWNDQGSLRLVFSTVTLNAAWGGSGGRGGFGYENDPGFQAIPGSDGSSAGGGLGTATGLTLLSNSIVADSPSGGNLAGPVVDGGHNLSSDESGALTGPGSRVGVKAGLGALGDHGGPTRTVTLLAGSPALDAADGSSCPPLDQRGVGRPVGAACDLGAVEIEGYLPPEVILTIHPSWLELGRFAVIDLLVTNGNSHLVLSNLQGRVRLPSELRWVEGSVVHDLPSLAAGETYRAQVRVEVTALGDHLVDAAFTSSLTGSSSTAGSARLTAVGAPEVLTTWGLWSADNQTATLEALVLPNSPASVAWCAYGPTEELGSKSACKTLPAAFLPTPILIRLEGISNIAALHFQWVTSNAFGVATSPRRALTPPKVVTTCDQEHLLEVVRTGGYVKLGCDGAIELRTPLLIERETVLDARGRQIRLTGNWASRLFEVQAGAELTLVNLTLERGFHAQRAAGILNDGGVVRILGGALVQNRVVGIPGSSTNDGGDASGGAILNRGQLYLADTRLEENLAVGGNGWTPEPYLAPPRPPTAGGVAQGGALAHESGTVAMLRCTLARNEARGGRGGNQQPNSMDAQPGRAGQGGAVHLESGRLYLVDSTVAENRAEGGHGGDGTEADCYSLPKAGTGGEGRGGAIHSLGELRIKGTTLVRNEAEGGGGGKGPAPCIYTPHELPGNPGANGEGGALWVSNVLSLVNCTVVSNRSVAGLGGAGGTPTMATARPGTAQGGGIWSSRGSPHVVHVTLAGNQAEIGADLAGTNTAFRLANCILAGEGSMARVAGAWEDLGANLSSDPRLAPQLLTTRSGLNPRLLSLADHGGPTWTLALASDSPALDVANRVFAPDFDQRGYPRPSGAGSDIGAFEVQEPPPTPSASAWLRADGTLAMRFVVLPNQWVVLETTTDWTTWSSVLTNLSDANGVFEAVDTQPLHHPWKFYRARRAP